MKLFVSFSHDIFELYVEHFQDSAAPTIHMNTDLKRIDKPLEAIVKAQEKDKPKETKIYFDIIHLSPLKVDNLNKNISVQHLLRYKTFCISNPSTFLIEKNTFSHFFKQNDNFGWVC
jgi:hypothetical protein